MFADTILNLTYTKKRIWRGETVHLYRVETESKAHCSCQVVLGEFGRLHAIRVIEDCDGHAAADDLYYLPCQFTLIQGMQKYWLKIQYTTISC